MKQKLLIIKSLLVAMCLLVGVNGAWAVDTPYNISSSESAYVDATSDETKAAIHNGSTLENLLSYNSQHRNWTTKNWAYSGSISFKTGGKVAYYKFPLSAVASETGYLKSATFKFTVNSTNDGSAVSKFMAVGYNGSQDWTGATLTYNNVANNGCLTLGYTIDYDGSYSILDDNEDKSGSASSVVSFDATTYTASVLATDADYITFAVCNNSTRTANLNVSATLELIYTSAAPFNYSVKAVESGNESNVLKTYVDNEVGYTGETYTVMYNKCVEKNGVWYETATKNAEPYLGVDVTAAGTSNVSYSANGASYFYEVESMPSARSNGSGGTGAGTIAPRRWSNGQAVRLYQYTRVYTPALAGGVYTIRLKGHNQGNSAANATLYLSNASGVISGEQIATFSTDWAKSELSEKTVEGVVIPEGSSLAIYNNSSSNSNLLLDYIILTRTGVSVSTLADRNYASYVTSAKLDFGNTDGITAYIATGFNAGKSAIVLTPVDVVPASTPIIVKTDTKGATVSVSVTTSDASDVSGNALVAGDGTTAWNGTDGYTYYYLASDLFHKATEGTLQSGKAYLKIANGDVPATARDFSFVFDDSETTGIDASLVNSEERIVKSYFDLQGRRVAQPSKGLYIVNGKKVVIK